jgi:hypothetical protein
VLYPGEKIRLLREMPDSGLTPGAICEVVSMSRGEEGSPGSVEIRWYGGGQARTATVPLDSVEPVLSTSTEQRTAALWALETPPEQLVETVMHAMLDRGMILSEGLNVARLHYDPQERWWKRDELVSDPAGAKVATSAHLWDGCVVGFAGEQRFHLEFRLKGRGEAALLLHEREAAYAKQARSIPAAMELARVLMDLCAAAMAHYCAFPVAYPWMMDEDWSSLLRPPYYPDIFLLPEAQALPELPEEFRTARLSHGRLMATDLPVKFAPHDSPPQPGQRELNLASLRKCKALGEKYYDQLYETHLGATGLYSSAKEAFHDAISLANQLGLKEEAEALERRLQHIKDVFRSQFT